jgi:polyhydroxybutyrate depolymerase
MKWAKAIVVGSAVVDASGACPSQGYPSGKLTKKTITGFDESGKNRNYHVHVPQNYDNSKPVPLHITWHGLNAPCVLPGGTYNNLKAEAEKRGYILVAPCGSAGDGSISMGIGFNSGRCCGFAKDSPTDEIAFTREIIKDVQAKLCIDTGAVWSSGFSNGAMQSEVLACEMGDVFTAVASVSGVVEIRPGGAGGLKACDTLVSKTAKRSAVLNVHGTADPMVPWQSDPIMGFPGIPKDMQAWADRSGCKTGPTTIFEQGKYTIQRWSDCTDGKHMDLVKKVGGGHAWPSDSDFSTTAYLHDFFYNASGMPLEETWSPLDEDAPISSSIHALV